jgi:Zinc-binding
LLQPKEKERFVDTMGGGNGQKSAAARERNQKKLASVKTDEERKAAAAKAAKDAAGFVCGLCKMTFMINVKAPTLYQHVTSKHPAGTDPASCFPSLAGYDPNAPASALAPAAAPVAPKPKKKAEPSLADLLSEGLPKGKKK